jgi:hypothetical protein
VSITVITSNGDFTVPAGQSWGAQFGPDGSIMTTVHDGPFSTVQPNKSNNNLDYDVPVACATGNVVGQFDSVEAIYPTNSVTKA